MSKLSQLLIERSAKKKIYKMFSNDTVTLCLEILIISVVQYGFTASINNAFGHFFNTGSNYFAVLFITPFMLMALCYVINVNPLIQFDLITPVFPLALIFLKLACFCGGCCTGVEWSYGLYNAETELVEFPVQLLEAAFALIIFIFFMFCRKKAKQGTIFPMFTILYSATRFFSEFLRCEPDVIWKLKTYHLLCIAGVVAGLGEYFIVVRYKDKIVELFDNSIIYKLFERKIGKSKDIVHHGKKHNK